MSAGLKTVTAELRLLASLHLVIYSFIVFSILHKKIYSLLQSLEFGVASIGIFNSEALGLFFSFSKRQKA